MGKIRVQLIVPHPKLTETNIFSYYKDVRCITFFFTILSIFLFSHYSKSHLNVIKIRVVMVCNLWSRGRFQRFMSYEIRSCLLL